MLQILMFLLVLSLVCSVVLAVRLSVVMFRMYLFWRAWFYIGVAITNTLLVGHIVDRTLYWWL